MLSLPALLLQFEGSSGPLADVAVDTTLIAMLSGLALVTLIVLGLRFLRNMFEIITAPTASLKYHGQSDHFFFSLMLVFLGGLIGTIIIMATLPNIVDAWTGYSSTVATDIAAGNPNPIYRDVAEAKALTTINNNFDTYFVQSIIAMPMVFIGLWLLIGTLCFLFAKMFGGQATWVDMHGTIAYGAFFWTIGLCLFMPVAFGFVSNQVNGPGPEFGAAAIAGAVLLLYGLVLFLIGVNQSADMTGGQTLGVIIALAVILFGAFYGINYKAAEAFGVFKGEIQSFNPAHQQI